MFSEITLEKDYAIGFNGTISQGIAFDNYHYAFPAGGNIIFHSFHNNEQTILSYHTNLINNFCSSRNCKYIASSQKGENCDIYVLDFSQKKLLYHITEHYSGVKALTFSHDEYFLATVGDSIDKQIYIWDMQTGNIVCNHPILPTDLNAICWGGRVRDCNENITDNYLLATCGNDCVYIWCFFPGTGKISVQKCSTTNHHRIYTSLAFSLDNEILYVGSQTEYVGDISLFQIRNASYSNNIPVCSGGVNHIIITPTWLGIGGGDSTVYIIHFEEIHQKPKSHQFDDVISSFVVDSSYNKAFIGTISGSIYRLAVPSLIGCRLVGQHHNSAITSISFSLGVSDIFASASKDGTIRCWNISDYSMLFCFKAPNQTIPLSLVVIKEDIIVGFSDGHIRCYNKTADIKWTIDNAHKGGVTVLIRSYHHRFLVSGGQKGDVRVWDLTGLKMVTHLKEHNHAITSLCLFYDNVHCLSSSNEKFIIGWNLYSEKRFITLPMVLSGVHCIDLNNDQMTLAAACIDHRLRIYRLPQIDPIITLDHIHDQVLAVCFSGDGQFLATGNTISVSRVSVRDRNWHNEITLNYNVFMGAYFQVLIRGVDCKIHLYHVPSNYKKVAEVKGHSDSVTRLTFTADNMQLVSAGLDGLIFIWNILKI